MVEQNKKLQKIKISHKLLIVGSILIIICMPIALLIGNYFVNYALLRTGNGGDRKVKGSELLSAVNIENSDKIIIEENKNKENQLVNEWVNNINNKKVMVTAQDGIILRGTEYITDEKANKWAIILHGYRSNPDSVISIGRHFSENGYNVLIPSMRSSNESDGKYIGMGWLDKEDLKCWLSLVIQQNSDAKIILHGSSMGAATVLMASGDNLPKNVKAIIEDSGYTSAWDIFASEAKVRFNLPAFPLLNMFEFVANVRAKYDIKEASALEQVKKSNLPILFIHGDADDFVPEYMCEELFKAANCKKEKLIIKHAGHIESKFQDPEMYYNKIFSFIEYINF